MRRPRTALLVGLLALVVTRLPAQLLPSATIASGTWHGWVLRQDEDSLPVAWVVEQKGKSITIELRAPNNPDYGMGDIKLKDDVLTFTWAMGQESFLVCRLSRRGSPGFDGTCEDARRDSQGGRTKLFVNMTPPRSGRGARPDSTFR